MTNWSIGVGKLDDKSCQKLTLMVGPKEVTTRAGCLIKRNAMGVSFVRVEAITPFFSTSLPIAYACL